MVFPEEEYYRLNYILLSSIGLWPYDNVGFRLIQVMFVLLIYISSLTLQFMKLFVPGCSLDLLLEVLAINFFDLVWFIKYITFFSIMGHIKQLRNHIRNNWNSLTDDREINIMLKYVNFGKQSTIATGLSVYLGCLGLTLVPYIPSILDIIKPLNESRPRILLHQTKYFANQDKYIHIVIMHEAIGRFIFGTIGIAAETYSLVNALHALGMFRIAGYRMEHMLTADVAQLSITENYIEFHDKIIAAVDTHIRAFEFSELLKASFAISYLCMLITLMSAATVSLYRIFRVITLQQEKLELVKLFCYLFLVFLLLIIGNFVGQEFINHDSHVHRMICNTKWYNAPLKVQKFILFLMRKTINSYKVDAFGLFSPGLEVLSKVMSLLLSFFTILCSL